MVQDGLGIEIIPAELKGLDDSQLCILENHYAAGLRGDDLRYWKAENASTKITDPQAKALAFLMSERQVSLEDAVAKITPLNEASLDALMAFCEKHNMSAEDTLAETEGLDEHQLRILDKNYAAGLRAQHLRTLKKYGIVRITDLQARTLAFLISEHKVSLEDAVVEIARLNKASLAALMELYENGLRGENLRHGQENQQEFTVFHKKALSVLVKEPHNMSMRCALNQIDGLNEFQAYALKENYAAGLRGGHLRDWNSSNPISTSAHVRALYCLITERGVTPEKAIAKINSLDEEQARMLQQKTLKSDRGVGILASIVGGFFTPVFLGIPFLAWGIARIIDSNRQLTEEQNSRLLNSDLEAELEEPHTGHTNVLDPTDVSSLSSAVRINPLNDEQNDSDDDNAVADVVRVSRHLTA